jgi:X-X-X-Leu-X-X-Gly heptad repeat protein
MKKILIQKLTTAVLITILLAGFAWPANAADEPSRKEEVVYGILNPDGSVKNVYVVNIFKGGKITDYGNYTEIRNLTTSEKINQSGDLITVETGADKLYYQATLESKELPWLIAIHYKLDGKEISGAELAGQRGALQIAISVTPNAQVNRTFYDNYALQISLQLDTKLSENIKAENATIAEAGGNKQLTYTVLPGKGADIAVTADVHDFEMEPITLNGIKLMFGMSLDDQELSGELSQLAAAIRKLDDGAGDLLAGADRLADGMNQYLAGLKAYKDGLAELETGTSGLNAGASSLKKGLADLSGQNQTLMSGAMALQQSAFDTVNAQLDATDSGLPVLTPQNYSAVLGEFLSLPVKAQLDGAVQFTAGLKNYTDGVAQLGTGALDLAEGAAQLESSASTAASAANDLYSGGEELNKALQQLRDGLASYQVGTKTLRNQTANMDKQISGKIDEMIESISGKGDPVISFVSPKNTHISAVQFVLKTQPIKRQETVTPAEKTAVLSFWQKLLKLFGL